MSLFRSDEQGARERVRARLSAFQECEAQALEHYGIRLTSYEWAQLGIKCKTGAVIPVTKDGNLTTFATRLRRAGAGIELTLYPVYCSDREVVVGLAPPNDSGVAP